MPDPHASASEPTLFEGETELLPRVSVWLPLPLDGPYDYLCPPETTLAPGDIVAVPLGPREVIGVVWERVEDDSPVAPERLKPVLARFPIPALPEVERRFIEWVAGYTMAPFGAVLRMAVSTPGAFEAPRTMTGYRLAARPDERAPEALVPEGLRITPARRRALEQAADGLARPGSDLARAAGVGTSVVKGLVAAGLLEAVDLPRGPVVEPPDWQRPPVDLSPAQTEAAAALRSGLAQGFQVTLLDGVTGAGKTEVYFEAVAAALAQGRQVLVLLPEIALSAQWLERFERRFGVLPVQWHSDLTSRQRRTNWRAVAEGDAKVVVGARSALFLPYPSLGLIVVDEEHESAFKQEDGVTYNARDMAVVRARLGRIPVILVSATPSLETMANVAAGRYRQLRLRQRHGGAELPAVAAVDLRRDKPAAIPGLGQSWLSGALRDAMAQSFAAGEQVLLFLNRRGYAPLTLCRSCGDRLKCPNCTAWLVEHRLVRRLQCHHCGHGSALPESCSACGAVGSFAACGPGVERLVEEVAALFPGQRTALMSSDSLTGPLAAAELLRAVQDREIDLLIGTQVVAKGHHFPWLTCVGVIDADLGLAGGDLRAAERTFQLLQQVAGRAGRADRPGRVLLQTYEPDHPVIAALVSGDRDAFLEIETEARRRAAMPPFSRLAALILSSPDPELLDQVRRALARQAPQGPGLEVLGPAPAPLAVLRRRHRRRFLLRTRRDQAPQPLLRDWLRQVEIPRAVRLQIDIDPYSFM